MWELAAATLQQVHTQHFAISFNFRVTSPWLSLPALGAYFIDFFLIFIF